jgi:PEP-CTERM motif
MMGRGFGMAMAVAIATLLAVGSAQALPTINIDQGTGGGQAGGTLTYDGEGGPLVGTGIGFGVLNAVDTALNTGTPLFCVPNCTLNFETGANIQEAVTVGTGLTQWTWGGGGTFEVEGTLNTAADGSGTDIATGTLLAGEFTGALGLVGPAGRLAVTGVGEDEKIGSLLEFYGISEFLPFRFASTDIIASGLVVGPNSSLSGTVTNADITNTQIPEPGTLLLLGSGLAGASLLRRRMKK